METVTTGKKLLRIDKEQLFRYFFFGVFIFLLYQFLRVITPFFDALLVSAVLSLIFFPVNIRLKALMPEKPYTAAAAATLLVLFICVIPLMFLGWKLLRETTQIYPTAQEWLSVFTGETSRPIESIIPPSLDNTWGKIQSIGATFDINLQDMVLGSLKNIQETIARSGGKIAKNLIFFAVDFLVMILGLFLFFKDGEKIVHRLIELAPMDNEHKQAIATRIYETTIAVVRGVLLTAALQGVLATIGYSIAGVPVPIFLGIATAFAALFPFGGTSLVWIPVGVIFALVKNVNWGIFILAWGALVVGLLDNILRPILIGRQAKLPIILLFLGLFGGLRAYGIRGIFLGPLLITCVLVFVQIYRSEYSGTKDTH